MNHIIKAQMVKQGTDPDDVTTIKGEVSENSSPGIIHYPGTGGKYDVIKGKILHRSCRLKAVY
jgi:hypothetical protein